MNGDCSPADGRALSFSAGGASSGWRRRQDEARREGAARCPWVTGWAHRCGGGPAARVFDGCEPAAVPTPGAQYSAGTVPPGPRPQRYGWFRFLVGSSFQPKARRSGDQPAELAGA
jgi:hypothetical protein